MRGPTGSCIEVLRLGGPPSGVAGMLEVRAMTTDSKASPRMRRIWRLSPEMPMGGFVDSKPPSLPDSPVDAESPDASKRMLTPPRPPSWRASSYDLMTGATVTEMEDTIPGDLFDQLFGRSD